MAWTEERARTAVQQFGNRFAKERSFLRGFIGNGFGLVEVPNRPDFVYVRIGPYSSDKVIEVFNKAVAPVDNWPVVIGRDDWTRRMQILHTDYPAIARWGGLSTAQGAVHGYSSHSFPGQSAVYTEYAGYDPTWVYPRMVIPLRVEALSTPTMQLYVQAGTYLDRSGHPTWFAGANTSDMTAWVPATGFRFVVVCLNVDTGVLAYVVGDIEAVASDTIPQIENADYWPLAAIGLYPTTTTLEEMQIVDLRQIAGQIGGGGYFKLDFVNLDHIVVKHMLGKIPNVQVIIKERELGFGLMPFGLGPFGLYCVGYREYGVWAWQQGFGSPEETMEIVHATDMSLVIQLSHVCTGSVICVV